MDVVFGPQTLHRLPQLIAERKAKRAGRVDVSFPRSRNSTPLPPAEVKGAAAFVSIMEAAPSSAPSALFPTPGGRGVTPLPRCSPRWPIWRPTGSEVTLLGQNECLPRGHGRRRGEGRSGPADRYIAEMPGIERIRYTTSHPREMTQRLIDTYSRYRNWSPPASACPGGLRPRSGGHEAGLYLGSRIQIHRPQAAGRPARYLAFLGFHRRLPGETDEDFERTMKLIDDVGFDTSFSFVYSPRPGTPALELPTTRRPQSNPPA